MSMSIKQRVKQSNIAKRSNTIHDLEKIYLRTRKLFRNTLPNTLEWFNNGQTVLIVKNQLKELATLQAREKKEFKQSVWAKRDTEENRARIQYKTIQSAKRRSTSEAYKEWVKKQETQQLLTIHNQMAVDAIRVTV